MTDQTPFWRELIVESFRIGVRIGVHSVHTSVTELKHLLEVAFERELSSMGYDMSERAVLGSCSRTSIKRYMRLSRALAEAPPALDLLQAIIDRLRRKPYTQAELANILPPGDRFDPAAIAISLLLNRELIEQRRDGNRVVYALTSRCENWDEQEWQAPLSFIANHYLLGIELMSLICQGIGPSIAQLEAALARGRPGLKHSAFLETVEMLRALELVELKLGAGGVQEMRVLKPSICLVPSDKDLARQVGVLDALKKQRFFFDIFGQNPDPGLYSNLCWQVQATPEKMKLVLEAHRDWTRQALQALEQECEGMPEVRPFVLHSHSFPLPQEYVAAEDSDPDLEG